MERGSQGRASAAGVPLLQPDLVVGAATRSDLAGGGGGWNHGRCNGARCWMVASHGGRRCGMLLVVIAPPPPTHFAIGGQRLPWCHWCSIVSGSGVVHWRSWMDTSVGTLVGGGGVWWATASTVISIEGRGYGARWRQLFGIYGRGRKGVRWRAQR
jgi:hypothetical protein